MQTLQQSYRGFSLLVSLNADRVLFVMAIPFALMLGAYLLGL
ncbi:hypothetical protein ACFO5X_07930 [Seohaeicola nanhaiensis]|uniref:ABC transporter permease n=1 Tax=Seohaeicola nanhaiensis TaxID=1387282 RepID=A0ABV9KEN8_9RHOB